MDRAEYVAQQRSETEWAHTHETAQAAIRAAVPGARVTFLVSRNGEPNGRHYVISADRLRREMPDGTVTDVALNGAYMLPAPIVALQTDARNSLDNALRSMG